MLRLNHDFLGRITLCALLIGGGAFFPPWIAAARTDPKEEVATLFEELAKKSEIQKRAVEKIETILELIAAIDEELATVHRKLEEYNDKVKQNAGNCAGTYEEPEYSYWLAFCNALEEEGEALETAQRELNRRRGQLLDGAKSAQADHEAAEQRIGILLAKLRVNQLVSQLSCGYTAPGPSDQDSSVVKPYPSRWCENEETTAAQVSCYQACWERAQPIVKQLAAAHKQVLPGKLKAALESSAVSSGGDKTRVLLDALGVGGGSWQKTLAYLADARRRYPNNLAVRDAAAMVSGITLGIVEKPPSLGIDVIIEQQGLNYETWSLVERSYTHGKRAIESSGASDFDRGIRELTIARRLLQQAQEKAPNNLGIRDRINFLEGWIIWIEGKKQGLW